MYGAALASDYFGDNPYSRPSQEAFVQGCTKSGAPEPRCWLIIRWMQVAVPVEEVKAYSQSVNSPGFTHAQDPPWVGQAVNACRAVR